jgi:hypothetical protein
MVRCARQNEGSVLTAPHGRSECCGPPETRKRGPGPGPVSVPRFGNVRNRDMLAPFSGFRFIELFSQPNRKPHLIMPPIPDCRSQIAAMPAGHTAQASVLVSVLAIRKTKMWSSALLPCMHVVESRNSGIESSQQVLGRTAHTDASDLLCCWVEGLLYSNQILYLPSRNDICT